MVLATDGKVIPQFRDWRNNAIVKLKACNDVVVVFNVGPDVSEPVFRPGNWVDYLSRLARKLDAIRDTKERLESAAKAREIAEAARRESARKAEWQRTRNLPIDDGDLFD